MTPFPDWLLTPQRVAIHQPTATAVVADLHLGYHEARRQSGDAIPLPDLNTILAPLLTVLERGIVKSLLIAGDLFERAFDAALWSDFYLRLRNTGVHFEGLIPGNHDRALTGDLPLLPEGKQLGSWHVVHGDGVIPPTPTVLGHFHPSIRQGGRKVPCYIAAADRLFLPAYSKDAAGVSALPMIGRHGYCCFAIVSGTVVEMRANGAAHEVSG
jgi:metallophosphoesterase superfamily enzyme